jgi:hypothetical protein
MASEDPSLHPPRVTRRSECVPARPQELAAVGGSPDLTAVFGEKRIVSAGAAPTCAAPVET